MINLMTYQYLWCASCATRRAGHAFQCSVCGGLLRHDTRRAAATPATLRTTVTWQAPVAQPAPQPERQPVAA